MPSFGALRELARGQGSEKKLERLTIHMPEAGGREMTRVEHKYAEPHPAEKFQFAAHENAELGAHLSKHLGIKLPGKAAGAGDSAESEASKENFE